MITEIIIILGVWTFIESLKTPKNYYPLITLSIIFVILCKLIKKLL